MIKCSQSSLFSQHRRSSSGKLVSLLKGELEAKGYNVIVPQFPSPPVVAAKIAEWFDVLKDYEEEMNADTVIVGHSLGGVFTLRILEKLGHPIKAATFVGAPASALFFFFAM